MTTGKRDEVGKSEEMTTASEVFSPEHGQITLYMAWKGRGETSGEIAARLLPTMSVLAGRYSNDSAGFYSLGGDNLESRIRLPGNLKELAVYAAGKTDQDEDGAHHENGRTRLVALLLPDPSAPDLQSDAMLSVVAGTSLGLTNKVSVQFESGFPLGTPAEAARWFLELVRIWQPEYALLKTGLTNSTDYSLGTYAGYLSWVSNKAFDPVPPLASAVQIPFGDGMLYAARNWTLDGFAALSRDLAKAGAGQVLQIPKFQDPPEFPSQYPEELFRLDEQVRWDAR